MKIRILVILIFCVGFLDAQELNNVGFDIKTNQDVLVGECNRNGFNLPPFYNFFNKGYSDYKPDETQISQIKKLRKNVEVVIVFGSWCHDTKTQLPAFMKIFDAAGFKDKDLKLYGVDGNKSAGEVDIAWLEISRVPTFIFYKGAREIGRIVEKPTTSLEKDILMILTLGL
jgi:thiol-disulfide isomerase/thioredoxin